jgi:hypothetical protein
MPSKIDPNLDFWFENKPSGNPAVIVEQLSFRCCFFRKFRGKKSLKKNWVTKKSVTTTEPLKSDGGVTTSRVTRWGCEKIAQSVAQLICDKINAYIAFTT